MNDTFSNLATIHLSRWTARVKVAQSLMKNYPALINLYKKIVKDKSYSDTLKVIDGLFKELQKFGTVLALCIAHATFETT